MRQRIYCASSILRQEVEENGNYIPISEEFVGSLKKWKNGNYLEGPQEIRGIFEASANSEYFVDQILHTDDVSLACQQKCCCYFSQQISNIFH